MKRGPFLKSLEESITITPWDLLNPTGPPRSGRDAAWTVSHAIVMERRTPRTTPEGYVEQELVYIVNISPFPDTITPSELTRTENGNTVLRIETTDQITRNQRTSTDWRGSTDNPQILVVEDIRVISYRDGKIQLYCKDRDRTVR